MNWSELLTAWLQPISLCFALLLGSLFYAGWQAQGRPDFDWTELFKNDQGKVSIGSFCGAGAFVISSYMLMLHYSIEALWAYLITWSASAQLAKFIDGYTRMHGAPPPTPPVPAQNDDVPPARRPVRKPRRSR